MLVELFYQIDEFCKLLNTVKNTKRLNKATNSMLADSEIMTICVYYHFSGYKTFKDFYAKKMLVDHRGDFKNLVSYTRFVELKQEVAYKLGLLAKILCHLNKHTGISFIDSFSLPICHNRRIHSNKVFKGIAERGKTSTGWFFGFKVHIVVDPEGNILNFDFTPGNVADNNKEAFKVLIWQSIW